MSNHSSGLSEERRGRGEKVPAALFAMVSLATEVREATKQEIMLGHAEGRRFS
jgi:hypothetical protein